MPMEAELAAAVAEARRLRGTVTLNVDGDKARWCAVIAAVDGALELRVGLPRGGAIRGGAPLRKRAMRARGWQRGYDCWVRPLPAATAEADAARELAEGLQEGLRPRPEAEPRRAYVQTGGHPSELPAADAPPAEHVAAVLRSLVRNARGHADVSGGRPADVWAFVWVTEEAELLVELCAPGDPNDVRRIWSEPLTDAGAEAAALALTEAAQAERPGAADEPLFVALIDPAELDAWDV
jgi:hypothetical protein